MRVDQVDRKRWYLVAARSISGDAEVLFCNCVLRACAAASRDFMAPHTDGRCADSGSEGSTGG